MPAEMRLISRHEFYAHNWITHELNFVRSKELDKIKMKSREGILDTLLCTECTTLTVNEQECS